MGILYVYSEWLQVQHNGLASLALMAFLHVRALRTRCGPFETAGRAPTLGAQVIPPKTRGQVILPPAQVVGRFPCMPGITLSMMSITKGSPHPYICTGGWEGTYCTSAISDHFRCVMYSIFCPSSPQFYCLSSRRDVVCLVMGI